MDKMEQKQRENKDMKVSVEAHPDFKFDRQTTQYSMENAEEDMTSRDLGNIKIRNTIRAAEEKLAQQNPGVK
jgi:hypothetical protein